MQLVGFLTFWREDALTELVLLVGWAPCVGVVLGEGGGRIVLRFSLSWHGAFI